MATTTTNNGWTIPQSTDLVTNGATAIATLGNGIDTSVGAGLKAWTAFTPTLSGGWTVGNGTWASYYTQLGKLVFWRMRFTAGSTTTFAGTPGFSLPVTAKSSGITHNPVPVYLGAAGATYFGIAYIATTTRVDMVAQLASGTYVANATISATVPSTWASGNSIEFAMCYEAA